MIEELLGWLASSENALLAMEEDPLPPEGPIIEEMLREHQVNIDQYIGLFSNTKRSQCIGLR